MSDGGFEVKFQLGLVKGPGEMWKRTVEVDALSFSGQSCGPAADRGIERQGVCSRLSPGSGSGVNRPLCLETGRCKVLKKKHEAPPSFLHHCASGQTEA